MAVSTRSTKSSLAEAIAARQGRIIFVGSNADAARYASRGVPVIDLGGQTVVPGLMDAHCHLSGVGEREMTLNFEGALGSKGAALLENYADYNTAGFLKWKEADLLPLFEAALRQGIQVWTHAIGDRANRETLNLHQAPLSGLQPRTRKERGHSCRPRWMGLLSSGQECPRSGEASERGLDAALAFLG